MQTIDDDLTRIANYARKLGYHGILILSKRCPGCGGCHDFEMTTDLYGDTPEEQDISGLLYDFAEKSKLPPSAIEDLDGEERLQ